MRSTLALVPIVAALVSGCTGAAPSWLARARVRAPEPSAFAASEWRTLPPKPAEFPHYPFSVAFSRDSRLLAIGYDDDCVRLYDCVADSELAPPVDATSRYANHALFSPDGSLVALSGDGVKAWDLETGRKVIDVDEGEPFVSNDDFAFSPDGRLLATTNVRLGLSTLFFGSPGEVRVRDLSTGKRILKYVAHEGPAAGVAFSPDGKKLAFGSGGRFWFHGNLHFGPCCKLRVIDLATGKVHFTAGMSHWIGSVAFSPDGRTVAAADLRGGIALRDAATGHLLMVLRRPSQDPMGGTVAFSPDGRWVAAAVGERTHVWDAQTGAEQADAVPDEASTTVAFSPDGKLLATGDRQGRVRVWRVAAAP